MTKGGDAGRDGGNLIEKRLGGGVTGGVAAGVEPRPFLREDSGNKGEGGLRSTRWDKATKAFQRTEINKLANTA